MITVQIEHIGRTTARELYELLAGSATDLNIELNYHSLSRLEVSGGPEILKILLEYYNV